MIKVSDTVVVAKVDGLDANYGIEVGSKVKVHDIITLQAEQFITILIQGVTLAGDYEWYIPIERCVPESEWTV